MGSGPRPPSPPLAAGALRRALSLAASLALACSQVDASKASLEACPSPFGFHLVAGGLADAPDPGTACRRPVAAAALPAGEVIHVGQRTVGDLVAVEVPSGTQSLTITSQRVSAVDSIQVPTAGGLLTLDNSVVPTHLIEPSDGRVIFDDTTPFVADPSMLPAYYGGESPSTGAMTIPNASPSLWAWRGDGLPPGQWTFIVNDWAYECLSFPGCQGGSGAGVYDITAIAKAGTPAAVGTLDVAFYLVTPTVLGGLTSASAVANPDVRRMVAALATYLAGAGVCLGKVTFYDVPDWAKARYASLNVDQTGPCSDLGQMSTLSRAGAALDFFLVDEIVATGTQGFTIVGMDGTIPGPSGFGGTVHSGAAVSTADLGFGTCGPSATPGQCGDDTTGYIAAHEAGHWLGLYHTTEATGDLFDPLADTAKCPCSACAPAASLARCASANPVGPPYFMRAADCTKSTACGGGDNLMFWLIDRGAKGLLSPEQGEVVRAGPIVR